MRFFLVIVVGLWAGCASAEVLTWRCHFQTRTDETGTNSEEMLLEFKVDTLSQKGYMEGNLGIVDVEVFVGDEAFSFLEKVGSGAVQTTTVTSDGLAVHSRNTVLFGELVPAQHHGVCQFE